MEYEISDRLYADIMEERESEATAPDLLEALKAAARPMVEYLRKYGLDKEASSLSVEIVNLDISLAEQEAANGAYEIEEVKYGDKDIRGYYIFDRGITDKTTSDLAWSNRGSGPELTNQSSYGVEGPFECLKDVQRWIREETGGKQ